MERGRPGRQLLKMPRPMSGVVGPCLLGVKFSGRSTATFSGVSLGGAQVGRLRGDVADPASAAEVHLFRDCP